MLSTDSVGQELIFKPNCKLQEFEKALESLARRISIFLQSFEYIQDYLACYGLKLWQEEFSRIVHYNVRYLLLSYVNSQ